VTTLTLIRHAQPQAWIDNIVAGPVGDTGLSELGRRQAAALRDRLASSGYVTDVLLTSVLPRAIETAAILAPVLDGVEADQHCDFCELHPGDADGMPWNEYQAAHGVVPHETPDQPFSPNGESLREFERRVQRALGDILERYAGQQITLVSHGGFISATCLELLGCRITERRGFLLTPDLTSLTTWVTTDERDDLWRLERYNDAAHLEGTMMRT
jgi:probable phosphoglycerate mutase